MTFLTVLAWILGCVSSFVLACTIIANITYRLDELEQTLDRLRGRTKRFIYWRAGTIAIVCWAWIITGGA